MKTSCFFLLIFLFTTIKFLFAQQPPAPVVSTSYIKYLPPVFFGYNGNNVIGQDDGGNFLSFSSDELRKVIPQLHATLIRFPAGGKSKSWDWNGGWHLDDEVFAYGNTIPNFIGNDCVKMLDDEAPPINGTQYQGNQLTALKGAWTRAGTSFMIPLNMISSNKDYQLEQVRQAYKLMKKSTVNDTVYVELGNEVYNKADPALKCLFAEPEDYLVVANEYLDALHNSNFLPGENIKLSVGVVAAATSVQDKSLTLDCHYNTWNAELGLPYYASAGNDRLHLTKGDGLIFHIYPESGLAAEANGIPAATVANADILFQVALNNIDKMKNNELKAVPPGINAWITEFNLTDEKNVYVRGTWAHGLFTALQALTFLEASSVSKINCHDLINDSGRSSVFSKSTGFDYAEDCNALESLTTGAYKLTAQGMALSMVGEAMKKSTKAQQINFAADFGSYAFANGRCKLYGWQFTKKDANSAEYNETIILNLGDAPQEIKLSGIYSSPSTSVVYESIYPEDGQPFIYVTNDAAPGEAYAVSTACIATQSNLTVSGYQDYNNSITLEPYSIVHIKKANLASTSVAVYPAKTIDVCSGESVNIFASGAASYKWENNSTSSFTLLDEKGDVVNENVYNETAVVVSNVSAGGTITLTPKNALGFSLGTVTITINAKSKPATPAIDVIQPSTGSSCLANLECTNAGSNSILWWPTTGILGNHTVLSAVEIAARPIHPAIYNNVLINSDGCYSEAPATEITFNNKKLNIGTITQPCYGQDVTLSLTDNNCSTSCTYKWTSSSGQSGTGTSFAINDIEKTATVFVERTDNAVCVEGASKTVKVNPEFDSFQREFSSCEDECIRLKFQMKGNPDNFCYDWENAVISTVASGATAVLQGWQVSGETCNGNSPSSSSPQAAFKATTIGSNTTAVFTVTVNVREEPCTTACYNQAVFTITVSGTPDVSITPATVLYCTGGFGAATIDIPAGSKVVFMDGSGLDQTTANEVMASPPGGGNRTYEFTVINEAGCCSHGYEIEFEEEENCCNSADGALFTYMNPTAQTLIYNLALKGLAADWNTGVIDFTNASNKISINGNLVLHNALTLKKMNDVVFADNAAIHLNGQTFTLDKSTLYSCDGTNMWNGITNNGNNASGLIITGSSTEYSKIKDAVTGAEFTGGGVLQIEFAEFDNNHVDLSIRNFCSGLASSDYISDCNFLNTAGSSLKAPYNGQQKYAAIAFYKTDGGTIGSTTTGANVFNGGDHGLLVTKSKLTLLNNDFSSFTNAGGQGYAIYHSSVGSEAGDCTGTSAFVKVGDGTTGGANTFTDCDYGVYSKSARLTIDFNTFTNVPRSIYVEGSSGKQLVIQNNTLDAAELGISLLQTQASSITLFNNDIELSGLSSTGDYYGIKQADNGSAINSTIEDNVVSIEDNANCKAIFIQASSGVQLINNTVYWNFSGTCGDPCPQVYGIRLEDASSCTLDCNHISGTSTIASYIEGKRGISLSSSHSCSLTCNTTDKLKSGLEFLADCNNAVIKGNTLNAHKYGMLVGYDQVEGVIGDQLVATVAPGNRYQGNNNSGNFLGSGYGLYRYLSSGTNPPFINFDVISNTTSDFYTTSSASNKANGAILQLPKTVDPFECIEDCQSTLREGEEVSSSDSLLTNFESILTDSAIEGSTYEVILWSLQKNLYAAIKDVAVLVDSSEVISTFLSNAADGNIGKLVNAEVLLAELNDTLLSDAARISKSDSIDMLLDSVTGDKLYENNAKQVYKIWLQTLAFQTDTFSHDQATELHDIAIQCPYYGGPAVYAARAIYALINDSLWYDDDKLCIEVIEPVKFNESKSTLNSSPLLEAFPNPCEEVISVSFQFPINHLPGKIILTDVYGKVLADFEPNSTSGMEIFNLKSFPSGIYMLLLLDAEGRRVSFSKVVKA
ncbi:MAG: T9SS type A sorting domain-containing protein [Chitinophagaceae bacterium]|nr:T9SS type A sorting domain-containing protein [Chitinophagaceae bacterium]